MKRSNTMKLRGSAITMAIIFTMILGFLMGSYLDLSREEMRMAHRTYMKQASISITEAIAENAIQMILSGSASGWTTADTNADGDIDIAYRRLGNIGAGTATSNGKTYGSYGNGFLGEGFVFIDDIQGAPAMRIEGRILDRDGFTSTTQIEMEIRRRSLFANGLTSKSTLTFSGGNVYVDSYDSAAGVYSKPGNYNDKGSVGTIAVVNDALSPGNGEIFGSIGSGGGSIDIGANGRVYGWNTPPGVDQDPNRISYDFFATFDDVDDPTLSSPNTSIQDASGNNVFGTASLGGGGFISGSGGPPGGGGGPPGGGGGGGSTVTIGDPTGATVTYYELDGLSLSGGDSLEVVGPVVIVMNGDISTSGTGEIDIAAPNGSLEVYTPHNVSISGNGFVNESSDPSKFLLYGTAGTPGGQSITVAGNGALHAAVYAPNAAFELRGGGASGEMMGSVVADTIFMNGVTNFHYDERLADLFGPDASWQLTNWFEVINPSDKLDFDAIESGATTINSVSL